MTTFHLLVSLQLLVLTASHDAFRISSSRSAALVLNRRRTFDTRTMTPSWSVLRGGSTSSISEDEYSEEEDEDHQEVDSEEEAESEDEDESESEDEEVDENPLDTVISSEPLQVSIKTNLGSPLVDTSLELLVARSRNVGSIKLSLQRQMPGRPPVSSQRLLLDGRELQDDELVDELVDDDEEDEEEEEDSLKLILSMVPPVDPKFATNLNKINDMSTSELLDAYAANAAAMYHNSQLLFSSRAGEQEEGSNLRKEAHEIRQVLVQGMPENALELLQQQQDPQKDGDALEKQRRGQRQRTGRGGATHNVKRVLQRNLNINWSDTIRNFILFVLFGIFGGRNTVSKHLLLLGAPLCFVLQARPVKIMLKQGFYLLKDPPGILLSLLPAPQQAILSFDAEKSRAALYGGAEEKVVQEDDDDEEEGEEMVQDGYDDSYDDETEDEYDDY